MSLPDALQLNIVSPDRRVVSEQVSEVELPGTEGYLGILPGHTPLMTELAVGQLSYRKGQERFYLFIGAGMAEVLPDRVTVLARVAERAEEIDMARAETSRKRAESHLKGPTTQEADLQRARMAMLTSLTRLQVAERARTRR